MRLISLFLGVLLASCVPAPQRRDPFESLSSSNAAYKNITVGLVFSENTRDAIKYVNKKCKWVGVDGTGPAFGGIAPTIQKSFGSVTKFESIEDAQAAPVDLIVLLDMYAKLTTGVWESYKVEANAIFMTREKREIEVIRAEGSSTGYIVCGPTLTGAGTALTNKFDEHLSASQKLAEFARAQGNTRVNVQADSSPRPALSALPVLSPNYSLAGGIDDYAVIVGIENYLDLPAATYAERDAAAARHFIRAMGIPERNLTVLTGTRATKTGMEKTLEAWLPNNVSENSRVFFYYSGHGAPDTKTGDAYLVPSDGDPQYLAQTGYPLKRLYSKLGQLKAKSVLVVLDSCFSGAGGRSVLAKGTRPLVGKVDVALPSKGNISVISASAGDQISGSNDDAGYGLFTYNFLQGLNGAAKDSRGQVTLKSLYGYLKPRVEDDARRNNREQVPQLQSGGNDIILRTK